MHGGEFTDTVVQLAWDYPSSLTEISLSQSRSWSKLWFRLLKVKPTPLQTCPRVNVTVRKLAAIVPLVISWPAAVSSSFNTSVVTIFPPYLSCGCQMDPCWVSTTVPRIQNTETTKATWQLWCLPLWSQQTAGYQTLRVNKSQSSLYQRQLRGC